MGKEKIQITLPETIIKLLKELCEKKGYSKSIIISMAIEQMVKTEKGIGNENK